MSLKKFIKEAEEKYEYRGKERNLFDFNPEFDAYDIVACDVPLYYGDDYRPYDKKYCQITNYSRNVENENWYQLRPIPKNNFILVSKRREINYKMPEEIHFQHDDSIRYFPKKVLTFIRKGTSAERMNEKYKFTGKEKDLFDRPPKFKDNELARYVNKDFKLLYANNKPYDDDIVSVQVPIKFEDKWYYVLVPIEDSGFILYSLDKEMIALSNKLGDNNPYGRYFPEDWLEKVKNK